MAPPPPSAASSAPQVFDRGLMRRHLRRALAGGSVDFLLGRVAEEVPERLLPVQRTFRAVLDLGTPRASVAAALASALPDAEVVRASGTPDQPDGRWLTVAADEEALPFAPASFDLAVSALALHGVNDLPGTLLQVRRALRPDGLFMACLLGGQSLHELRTCLTTAEIDLHGGASPRVAPFADLRDLGGLLQRAGFALPVTDVDPLTVRYDSPFGLMADLRSMGLSNAMVQRSRRPASRGLFARAAALYAERFSDPDGRVRATFELIWLSGWAPHESQQKPMRPGTAKVRLADALAAIRKDAEG